MGGYALNFLDVIGKVSDFWFFYPSQIQHSASKMYQNITLLNLAFHRVVRPVDIDNSLNRSDLNFSNG